MNRFDAEPAESGRDSPRLRPMTHHTTEDVTLTTTIPEDWPATRRVAIVSQAKGLARELQEALDSGSPPEDLLAQFEAFATGHLREFVNLRCDGAGGLEVRVGGTSAIRTDGGRDVEERRVEALEEIAAQQRYQSAALCELIATVEDVGLGIAGVDLPRSETRSEKAIQRDIADQDFTREEFHGDGEPSMWRDFR